MKKLLFIFLIIFSSQSFAEWELVSTSDDDSLKFYVDFDNLRERDGYIYFWQLMNSNKPVRVGDLFYQSATIYTKGDCDLFRMMSMQSTFYSQINGSGKMVYQLEHNNKWLYNRPNSSGDVVLKKVCE